MKNSIRKKIFIISILTTLFSFLLILFSFNYILGNYIEKETINEIDEAMINLQLKADFGFLVNAQMIDQKISVAIQEKDIKIIQSEKDIPKNIEKIEPTIIDQEKDAKIIQSEKKIAKNIESIEPSTDTALVDNIESEPDVEFILMDENNEVIYPITFKIIEKLRTSLDENDIMFGEGDTENKDNFFQLNEVNSLIQATKGDDFKTPKRMNINNTSYYVMKKSFENNTKAIFYKNTQSLDDLAKNVNMAIFLLLLLSSILTIALNMGLTNSMVKSIRKLCIFANSIGQGRLEQKNLHLKEKEFFVLEQDMNKMAQKLSEYDAEQKTFFQNVSHELRTPLMSIQGYAEGISSHVFKEEKIDDAANIILNESLRLNDMVNDLLYISRIDNNKSNNEKEQINLLDIIDSAITAVGGIVGDKKIILEKDSDCFLVYGNKEDLKRALINVLTNCIRYAQSKVLIKCSSEEKIVMISDDGLGIDEKDLPHIFKRFYKGNDGCSGIGLSIAEGIIKNHNGSIKAFNENGAVFVIKLS